jgi:hypothetical protein
MHTRGFLFLRIRSRSPHHIFSISDDKPPEGRLWAPDLRERSEGLYLDPLGTHALVFLPALRSTEEGVAVKIRAISHQSGWLVFSRGRKQPNGMSVRYFNSFKSGLIDGFP